MGFHTGIRNHYRAANAGLQQQVAERGLLLSQFLTEAGPARHHFPMRNTVMSGYSAVTIVVQASESSGTRHQVREAVKHGRPVILSASVADSTTWSRRFAEDPLNNVFVARDERDALRLVQQATHPALPRMVA